MTGGGVLPYMSYISMYRCEGYDFMKFTLGLGIQSRDFGLHRVSFFQETDQFVEDFSLDWGKWELPLKNQMGFVLAGLC